MNKLYLCPIFLKNRSMEVTYYGHSCFGLKIEGKHIVFDPFITDNPLAIDIHVSQIPCDMLLISHGHGDHIGDAVHLSKLTGAKVFGIYEITHWLSQQGVTNYHPMNIGGSVTHENITIKMVKAEHSSSFPDGTYAGTAAGYIIGTPNFQVYYSGDTALHSDMKIIKEQFDIDYAFLPIGDNFTMGINDAVIAAEWIGCRKVLGMHYDTFGYIQIDKKKAIETFSSRNIPLTLMNIGQTIHL
jgi:L-ascorbate metabolism protein UlaG (beta-lactamase superfamily)